MVRFDAWCFRKQCALWASLLPALQSLQPLLLAALIGSRAVRSGGYGFGGIISDSNSKLSFGGTKDVRRASTTELGGSPSLLLL